MGKLKKILLIEPFVPYPLNNGGAQAIFNGILAIKSRYRVYILFAQQEPEERLQAFSAAVGGDITILPTPTPPPLPLSLKHRIALSLYYRTGSDRLRPKDFFEDKMVEPVMSECFQEGVCRMIDQYHIDIVQVEMPWLMSAVLFLPDKVRKVFVHHELRFVRNGLELQTCGESIYRRTAVALNEILEIGILNRYDAIITLSPVDREKLLAHGVTTPVFSSYAIVGSSPEVEPIKEVRKVVSFVGPEFHLPNQKGLEWFLSECWDELRERNSDFELQIIGNWSEATRQRTVARYPGVRFLGFVDCLRDALRDTVMIVPITIGSGIRMKILEAAANGIPFVSTSVGAEGLPFVSGQECYIADSAEAFVKDIMRLQDCAQANAFVRAAHQRVVSQFSLAALSQDRCRILREVCP